jgi:hypothetical protein
MGFVQLGAALDLEPHVAASQVRLLFRVARRRASGEEKGRVFVSRKGRRRRAGSSFLGVARRRAEEKRGGEGAGLRFSE